jgi:hypothetical protein
MEEFRGDPVRYVRKRLGEEPTKQQEEVLNAAVTPPYMVLMRTGHNVGKSKTLAWLASYLYDTEPIGITVITAPKEKQLKDIVFRELRKTRRKARPRLGGWSGPQSLTLSDGDEHLLTGMTATSTEGFQGKHEVSTSVLIDEAGGVKPEFFEASETMVGGDSYCYVIALNPLSTACQAFLEEKSGRFTVVTMSCFDHPNIGLELAGQPPLIPAAIRLERLVGMVRKWCDPVETRDKKDRDFEFPRTGQTVDDKFQAVCREYRWNVEVEDGVVTAGQWFRPGPEAEGRILGVWPSAGVNTIWSELLFRKCRSNVITIRSHWRTAIGCDIARYGDDDTEIFVRRGPCVVHTEGHNGWSTDRTTARLKQLAHEFRGPEEPKWVRIWVDETGGLGASCVDNADGYNIRGINSAEKAPNEEYTNVRTQLWFDGRNQAREGLVDLSRLFKDQAAELEKQLMAQTYRIRPTDDKIHAVDKDKVKEKLKCSPDKADAFNLCFQQIVQEIL